jgi:uncharacterized membrane protein YeaQ/YmgE (transglycosylase-associated protein family)
MKFVKKTITFAIIVLFLMSSVTLLTGAPAQAQTADKQFAGPLPTGITANTTVETISYLSFRPNPIGVGQTLLVNVWLPPIHVARQFIQAYVVTITKPDGTTDVKTLDSYPGDATSWFEYVPDHVGNYTIKFDFLGTYFPRQVTPNGGIFAPSTTLESTYYKPSSTGAIQFVVQADPVGSWPSSGLPTDYWTEPVSSENRDWASILSSYPATGIVGGGTNWPADTNTYMSNYAFTPYVQGPSTAHIAWSQQYMIGGIVGGPAADVTNVPAGLTGSGFPTLIYQGRCYEAYAKPGTGSTAQTYWRCYDLRTGQMYWDQPATTVMAQGMFGLSATPLVPTFIEYGSQGAEVTGASAREGSTVTLDAITGGRLIKWDPYTGSIVTNVTGPSSDLSGNTLYAYPDVYSIQTIGAGPTAQHRLINWTIENNAGNWVTGGGGGQPTIDDFSQRVKGNITWPFSSLGTCDFETGVAVVTQAINSPGTGVSIGERIMAASLTTGQLLWNVTTDLSTGLTIFFAAPPVADHGLFAQRMLSGEWWAWNLQTGQIAWKVKVSSTWEQFGGYAVQSAYGLLYSEDYDGIRAINWTNGNVEWNFHAPSAYPYETYYEGNYSFHSAAIIADGKLYTFNTEHTPSQPLTRGWRLFCINATSGANIWNITCGQGLAGSRAFQGAIADGYLCMTNEYDGYTYFYGKGQSATTIQAPLTAITEGQSVVLTGTVLDQSPGQPGTPCVSAASMTQWMEYLHMQKPIPANVTGVPVSLDTLDPNGNLVHIATVTSDITGSYNYLWQPQVPGKYTVTATFTGDDSYGSSYAETAIGVVGASPTQTPTATSPQSIADTYFIPAIIGTIAAIVIVGAALALLMLRKRP